MGHRKRQQAQHSTLTLTNLYNVLEKLRASQPLTPKEQTTHEQGLAAVVLSLHQQLDAAVAEAYGWPATLSDAGILTRLVQLNQQRAAEVAAGTVRYLRPEYQAPGLQQGTMALPTAAPVAADVAPAEAQPWPAELAQQVQALRAVVQGAARFRGTKAAKVQLLLDTLASLARLRHVPERDVYTT